MIAKEYTVNTFWRRVRLKYFLLYYIDRVKNGWIRHIEFADKVYLPEVGAVRRMVSSTRSILQFFLNVLVYAVSWSFESGDREI